MFKRFMIVLGVLAALMSAWTAYEFSHYNRWKNVLLAHMDECRKMNREDLTWELNCNHMNPASEVNRIASIVLDISEKYERLTLYTIYIFLLMLISGVLHWTGNKWRKYQ